MGDYDPNRSSPDAQLNALLGKPAPDTGIGALLASQSARADTTRAPAPRADRGVVGIPRAPAATTETAAPATKEETREELQARVKKMMGEVPAPKGTSAEEKAARKNEDLFSALAQIGFGMAAGESPNALTNVGKAAASAMPGMQASLKERRAEAKEENAQMYSYELAKYGVNKDATVAAMSEFRDLSKQKQDERLALMRDATDRANARLQASTSRYAVDAQGRAPTAGMKEYEYYMSLTDAGKKEYLKLNPPYNPMTGFPGINTALGAAQTALLQARMTGTPADISAAQARVTQLMSMQESMMPGGGGGGNPPGAVPAASYFAK